ncbi:LCP family protein [Agrilactobacillus composti]|uniref:LCP family protein n=1 Tax=Agrilactobacillus composti TaxID=398555 RepID=UPI0009E872CA|nr:LCP family protein [Agrilactobacillus composti]
MAKRNHQFSHAKKSKHSVLKIVLIVILVLVVAGGAYAFRLYAQARSAVDSTYHPVAGKKASKNIQNKKPLSILLLGTDTGAEGRIEKGNSDTMIVATVNNSKKQTNLVSIPRDTMAKIYHKDSSQFDIEKINSAYFQGGSEAAINTVQNLINVPIDYYVTINMGALSKIVDAVGGVDVDVPFSFQYDWRNFKKGPMHLNGVEALAYSRMRYQDPDYDYGRQKRQQQVIKGIVKSAMSLKTLGNFEKIMKTLSGSVATNMSFDDMVSIYQEYHAATKTIKSDHLQGRNATIDGSSYQVAPTAELQRVSDKLRRSLGLDTATLDNEETKQNKLNSDYFANPESEDYTVFTPNSDTPNVTTSTSDTANTDDSTSGDDNSGY